MRAYVCIYIYIWPYLQGGKLRMNPKCDLEGSFFKRLLLSAVL